MRTLMTMMLVMSSAFASGAEEYLYAQGKKIPLEPSTRYVAVRASEDSRYAAMISNPSDKATSGGAAHVPILQQKGIVLLRKRPKLEFHQFMQYVFRNEKESAAEVPVYQLGSADVVLQDEIILKLKQPLEDASAKVRQLLQASGTVRRDSREQGEYRYLLTVKSLESTIQIANQIAQQEGVSYAEPNFIVVLPPYPRVPRSSPLPGPSSPSSTFPSDPLFGQQWALENSGSRGKTGADIKARKGWPGVPAGTSVVVAIVDEGVETGHPEFAGQIYSPFDAISGTSNQEPSPWDGHGTACAGIAAAATNNKIGISGVALQVKIMPIRVAVTEKPARGGDPHPWITTWATISKGIRTAVDNGADVISNSWGGGYSDDVNDSIDYALTRGRGGLGAVMVFAAGNAGTDVDWPANLSTTKTVIAVSATNEWDELKTFGSRDGEDWWASNSGPEITVAAPGVHILTTDIRGTAGYSPADYSATFNGTSSAAPFVAGEAALIIAKHPRWTAAQVRDQISKTADPVAPAIQTGHGRINLCKALEQPDCL